MFTYMTWLVDQRFGLSQFNSEEILAEHSKVDTVRFFSALDRFLLTNYEPNVRALCYILGCFTVRRVVHQLEKVFLCIVSAMLSALISVTLYVTG